MIRSVVYESDDGKLRASIVYKSEKAWLVCLMRRRRGSGPKWTMQPTTRTSLTSAQSTAREWCAGRRA